MNNVYVPLISLTTHPSSIVPPQLLPPFFLAPLTLSPFALPPSGMPECKLGLNDRVLLEAQGRATKGKAIDLDDIKFHQ